MPYYEFECEKCGYVIEKFYRSIPMVIPDKIVDECGCTSFPRVFNKIMSKNTFHLKGGGVGWGAGRYSSAHEKGTDVVSIDEP